MLTSKMKRKAADVVSRIDRVRYEQSSQPVVCKKKENTINTLNRLYSQAV